MQTDHLDFACTCSQDMGSKKLYHSEIIDKQAVRVSRLLIVGDKPAITKGLQMRLAAEVGLSIVGEASSFEIALKRLNITCPDIILVDVDMPHVDGFARVSEIHKIYPWSSIIILSMRDDNLTRELAEKAGAAAFVTKSQPVDELIATIYQVSSSEK